MSKETTKITRGAMQLMDEKCFATVKFSESEGEKKPTLDMLAYSGGIIKDHWWWGDLAIDLEGMKFPKKKFPILEDHDTSKKIGFIKKMSIENNQLTVVDAEFIDTPESLAFRNNSSQGFPYEASIYARPTKIQRLMEGEVATVNGYEMKGPGTIWRQSTFKESSVCTFGYDSNTKSAAFSESEDVCFEVVGETQKFEEEKGTMNIEQFKKEHPAVAELFTAEITAQAQLKFAEEKKTLETKLAELTEQNQKLSEEVKEAEKRNVALEKAEQKRNEEAMKHSADTIFAEKFKEAGLPDRLSAKVRRLVSHEQFIADGKLDTDAFSNAVSEELKDWAGDSGDSGDSSVMGFSTSSKGHESEEFTANQKAVDSTVDRMLSYVKIA